VYLNHHGSVHTLLPGLATITEKGVEQGQVIGLYFTEGRNDRRTSNIDLDVRGGDAKMVPNELQTILFKMV
jgi:hypothetical protein